MSIKKLLSLSAIVVLLGIFIGLDSAYASSFMSNADRPDGAETKEGTEETERRIDEKDKGRKGSIYDAISFMIAGGHYKDNAISRRDFQTNSGVNPATGEAYSDATIGRELQSSLRAGLLEQAANGDYYLPAGINQDVLDAINAEVGERIITRKEAGTDSALGLKRYNLTDLGPAKLDAIRAIVSRSSLTGNQNIQTIVFPASFAEAHGETLLEIVGSLRPDQQAIIISETGKQLNVIPELQTRIDAQEILLVPVQPGTPVATQFAEMFRDQNFIGFEADVDKIRLSIQQGEVRI